jgi:hypothetical protein
MIAYQAAHVTRFGRQCSLCSDGRPRLKKKAARKASFIWQARAFHEEPRPGLADTRPDPHAAPVRHTGGRKFRPNLARASASINLYFACRRPCRRQAARLATPRAISRIASSKTSSATRMQMPMRVRPPEAGSRMRPRGCSPCAACLGYHGHPSRRRFRNGDRWHQRRLP